MTILLWIIAAIILVPAALFGVLVFLRYRRRPKFRRGALKPLERRLLAADVYRPVDARTAERALAEINATLPADYLEMMRQTDGFTVGPWHVLGLAEVYSVALGEHNYYQLATDGSVAACVREGSQTGVVSVCALDDDAPTEEGESLRALIAESFDEV